MWTPKESKPKHRYGNKAYSDLVQVISWSLALLVIVLGLILGLDWLLAIGVLVAGLIVLKMLAEYWMKLYVIQYREKREGKLLT